MATAAIIHDADLSALSTFRLPASARELITLTAPEQLAELPANDLPLLVLGGGSNTIFLDDWPGRVLLNRLTGLQVQRLDEDYSLVHVGAGESWHRLVMDCIARGLHGLENLAMIPGSVGAAPIQNIGAYGVELSSVLASVTAWDWQHHQIVELSAADCRLSYRDSRFKSADRDRFLILSISLKLSHRFAPNTGYDSLAAELTRRQLATPSPRQLAATVMRLRRHRLPDPARLANAGSFFKNPVLAAAAAEALLMEFPRMPHWQMPDGRTKLAAGWMIERLGFRGYRIGDAGVYQHHALVLVNHGQATAGQLVDLIEHIQGAVGDEYGVELEPEPMLIGPIARSARNP
ncbi:MAG: UDP-N-acetylmuramate dehydrogenase [Wenzhouxiangellaceae bacterium]|nr:MAG: UDP-N-acetylmuramate dehydrogenase [Wenzhouxiangellaceae bacterium]